MAAEGQGFEPWEALASLVFKTSAFDRSATPPGTPMLHFFHARFKNPLRKAGIDGVAGCYTAGLQLRQSVVVISIAVHGAPYASAAARTALGFAESALRLGHRIHRVFFHHDAVAVAGSAAIAPQDEQDVQAGWIGLHETQDVELALCIANALKRGLLSDEERDRYAKPAATVHEAFAIVGLGQLVEAMSVSDRFVTFAA